MFKGYLAAFRWTTQKEHIRSGESGGLRSQHLALCTRRNLFGQPIRTSQKRRWVWEHVGTLACHGSNSRLAVFWISAEAPSLGGPGLKTWFRLRPSSFHAIARSMPNLRRESFCITGRGQECASLHVLFQRPLSTCMVVGKCNLYPQPAPPQFRQVPARVGFLLIFSPRVPITFLVLTGLVFGVTLPTPWDLAFLNCQSLAGAQIGI